jgi:RimJ/RimL family protein N-acetyltransferase
MAYILETQHLRLRQFTADDTDFIVRLLNSPGWLKFIGDRNVKTEEQARTYLLNGPIKSYQENGFGLWLVEIKPDGTPIGMCGLINRSELEAPDIGFAFLPEFIGQGYGYEIGQATLTHARDVLSMPRVLAITVPTNHTSITVLQKIGLKFSKTFSFPNKEEELLLFST